MRNIGSANSTGDYLAFLDDDDIWMENKLSIQINSMIQKNYLFSSTDGYFGSGVYNKENTYPIYNKERFLKTLKKKYRKTGYLKKNTFPEVWDYDFLKIHNCVILSSVIVQKSYLIDSEVSEVFQMLQIGIVGLVFSGSKIYYILISLYFIMIQNTETASFTASN